MLVVQEDSILPGIKVAQRRACYESLGARSRSQSLDLEFQASIQGDPG